MFLVIDLIRNKKYFCNLMYAVCLMFFTASISAQDLNPRAYTRVPVDLPFIVAGFGYTYGGVLLDPTLPIQDLEAKVETPSIGVGTTFSLLGLTSQAFVALPYSWAQVSGKVVGEDSSITRSGLGDTRFKFRGPRSNDGTVCKIFTSVCIRCKYSCHCTDRAILK